MADRTDLTDADDGRIEDLLRRLTPADTELVKPPDDLWDRIADAAGVERQPAPSDVAVLADRRRVRTGRWVLAAAAVMVALVAGGVALVNRSDDATELARADLAHDPEAFDPLGAGAAAQASLVDDDGALHIRLDDADLPATLGEDADLELWLIQPDADGNVADLVSLGLVGDGRDFAVPADHDPDDYFVVDISVEPRDGDEAHSGRSILRGPLSEV